MNKPLLFSILLAGGILTAQAYKVGDEIDLTSNIKGYVTAVNGTNIKMEVFANPNNKPTGAVELPYLYNLPTGETAVPTMISARGFQGCDITSITVGAGIEYIGQSAFYGCTKLASFTETVAGSVKSVGEYAFYHTDALEKISLPGVYTVNAWAFYFSGIKTADFTDIEYIYGGGFYECHNLETFTGGEKLKKVDNIAFCKDDKLKYVLLGPNLTEIGSMAFAYCTSLKEVVIPESVTFIDKQAFEGLAMERVFILSPDFMEFCDQSKILRNKYLTDIYCHSNMMTDIKDYIATGSEDNKPQFLASQAEIYPLSDLVEVKQVEGDEFTITPKYGDISAMMVFNPETGSEYRGTNFRYNLPGDKVGLQYRVDWKNLLRYTEKLDRMSGTIEINDSSESETIRYFDLQGREIRQPDKGIYLKKQGNTVRKVIGF